MINSSKKVKRNVTNNTYILNVEETKAKIAALDYIKKELSGEGNFVQ